MACLTFLRNTATVVTGFKKSPTLSQIILKIKIKIKIKKLKNNKSFTIRGSQFLYFIRIPIFRIS